MPLLHHFGGVSHTGMVGLSHTEGAGLSHTDFEATGSRSLRGKNNEGQICPSDEKVVTLQRECASCKRLA